MHVWVSLALLLLLPFLVELAELCLMEHKAMQINELPLPLLVAAYVRTYSTYPAYTHMNLLLVSTVPLLRRRGISHMLCSLHRPSFFFIICPNVIACSGRECPWLHSISIYVCV